MTAKTVENVTRSISLAARFKIFFEFFRVYGFWMGLQFQRTIFFVHQIQNCKLARKQSYKLSLIFLHAGSSVLFIHWPSVAWHSATVEQSCWPPILVSSCNVVQNKTFFGMHIKLFNDRCFFWRFCYWKHNFFNVWTENDFKVCNSKQVRVFSKRLNKTRSPSTAVLIFFFS